MFLETKRDGEAQARTKLEPWRQLLLDAADYMEQHGKCEHAYSTPDGRVCFYGALNVVQGLPARSDLIDALANQAVENFRRYVQHGPSHFNDTHSQAEVLAAMRETANG